MRQQGQYQDFSGNAYVAAQMQHMVGQQMEQKSGNFQGQVEVMEGQWKWERDCSKVSDAMQSQMFNEGQGSEPSRSFFEASRLDPKLALEKQANNDPRRSGSHEREMDTGYKKGSFLQTFEGLEQKFLDDLFKLAKEQANIEDTENARHVEKIKAINAGYQEQLEALRARHAVRRDEFLQRESNARRNEYQQAIVENYQSSGGTGQNDHRGYVGAPITAAHHAYESNSFNSHRERARFLGGTRDDQVFRPRGSYSGGRVYDTGSRYY